MAVEVQLDALPYIDHGYDEPGVREAVSTSRSIDDECWWNSAWELLPFFF